MANMRMQFLSIFFSNSMHENSDEEYEGRLTYDEDSSYEGPLILDEESVYLGQPFVC